MSIFGNFGTALESLITSERQAEFATLVQEKLYDKLNIGDFATIVEDVRHGDLSVSLVKEANYNSVKYTDADGCGIDTCDVSVNYSAKVWELVMAECRYPLCTREASRKFMALWNRYKAINPEDSQYDFLVDELTDLLADILANSLVAKAFLSDKEYVEETINGTNGFISQWLLETSNAVDITEILGTDLTDGEKWIEALQKMITAYDDSIFRKSLDSAEFIIDEVVARKIVQFLNSKKDLSGYDCSCIDADGITQKGRFTVDGLTISGIPVKVIPYTDMVTQFEDLVDDDGAPLSPIFAVLTPKTEVQLGTPASKELTMSESFYDKKDRMYYFDIGYQFGAMIPSNHFVFATYTPEEGGEVEP